MTTWKFYTKTADAWEAIYADCATARRSIYVEQYIFNDEPIGQRFADLLIAKAKEGVQVRLLLDMVGSYPLYRGGELTRKFIEAGVEVLFFHPVSMWRVNNITGWFFRDHRKFFIIDSKCAHLGGVGINAKTQNWRDTNVHIDGPVVEQVEIAFQKMWLFAKEGSYIRTTNPLVEYEGFQLLTNSPEFRQKHFYRRYKTAIRNAKHYIYITTPYFVPPIRLFRALQKAAQRGVDVRIVVPAVSDHRTLDLAAQSYYGLAMKAGIRIYQYKNVMMHAKTAVIDDAWSTVGSANLDNQSFEFCYEANLVTRNQDFVKELRSQFDIDLANSNELHRHDWEQRSKIERILEAVSWPSHFIL